MTGCPGGDFGAFRKTLEEAEIEIFLGQSVDTSVIHTRFEDFRALPVLTSVGCAIRRPTSLIPKFGQGLRARVGAPQRLIVDSGGFVLMKNPIANWSVEDVARLYTQIDADHLVTLDLPHTPTDSKQTRKAKDQQTRANTIILREKFGSKIMPVLHGSDPDELLRNAVEIRELYGGDPEVVGLGGLVPFLRRSGQVVRPGPDKPQTWIAQVVETAREVFPTSRLHMFGVGSVGTILGCVALGADSVDSIGWRQIAGFGYIALPGRNRRLISIRKRKSPRNDRLSAEDMEVLAACGCPVCSSTKSMDEQIYQLQTSFLPRALHNIWVLYREISGLVQSASNAECERFVAKRLSPAWLEVIERHRSPRRRIDHR